MNIMQQDVLGWIAITAVVSVLLKWHFSTEYADFTLLDLICTGGNLNDKKFMRTGAFMVMTWGFYAMVEDGKLTEWFAMLYGSLWVGNAALHEWLRQQQEKK